MSVFIRDDDTPRIGLIIFTVFAFFVMVSVVTFGIRWVTAPAKGQLQAREQIQSGDFRIQAYDHFFNLCASVQTIEVNLQATDAELQTASDPTDIQRLQVNHTGQLAARADAVNQYNADAQKSYTLGQFRASGLPYHIPITYEKGVTTSCGS